MNRYNNAYDETYYYTYNDLTDEFGDYSSYQQGYNDGYYGRTKNLQTYDNSTDTLSNINEFPEME